MFKIDNIEFDVGVTALSRKFAAQDRETARSTTTGTAIRSVIGSFYHYTVQLQTSALNPDFTRFSPHRMNFICLKCHTVRKRIPL